MGIGRRRIAPALAAAALLVGLTGCTVHVGTGSAGADSSSSTTASATAPSASPSTAAPVITVPLDVVHQGKATLAIVPVMVQGHGPYPFILDTGASTSGINRALAQQLGLPKTGKSATVSGVISSAKIPLVHIGTWSVHGVQLKPADVGALSFASGSSSSSSSDSSHGSGIAGLLGSDQLSRFGSITLDYAHQQLRFTPGT